MDGEAEIRTRESLEQAVGEHGARAAARFLGRLGDHHQGALPKIAELGEQPGSADQAGHVKVVAAGMHHRHIVALGILR